MEAFYFIEVDKNQIKAGDVILHNNVLTTVCKNNIRNCGFMGLSIFGDTYNGGRKKVLKGIYRGALK